jgi:hypothetical protein
MALAYNGTRYIDVAKRGGSWIGLTDEDVDLLRGWIVISWPLGWDILAQGLIELIEYSYQQDASSFSKAYLKRTSKLSVFGLEQFGMGDRPGCFLGCT